MKLEQVEVGQDWKPPTLANCEQVLQQFESEDREVSQGGHTHTSVEDREVSQGGHTHTSVEATHLYYEKL